VDAPDQALGRHLGDVAPDGHGGRAEGVGQVGDPQHAVALQRLEQPGPAGDLQRPAPL
jgi:hypothetical protein